MARESSAVSLGFSALIVIALIIIVGFGVYLNDAFDTGTTTNTSRLVGTTYIGSSSASTPSTVSSTPASNQFKLVFKQTPNCPNLGFVAPWTVSLSDGQSITANPWFGTSTICCSGSVNNPSTITFYLANGNYTFSVTPNLLTPAKGSVIVDNNDTVVTLVTQYFSCGSTTTGTTMFTSTAAPTHTTSQQQGWTQGGVASLVLTSPEVLSYVKPAYTYDLNIVQDPFAANLANALINVTETQSVSGNWTGSGYEVTYSGIMLNATVQFTSPSSYQLVSVGVTNLPNKTYSISYNSQQQHIIQVALSNSTVDSLVSNFTKYYVNEVSGLVGNGTGFYYVSIPQVDGPKAVSVSVNAAMTAVISATSGYNGGGVCFYNPYFCYTVPWNSTTG